MFKNIKTKSDLEVELSNKLKLNRISELKNLLTKSDFKFNTDYSGDIDEIKELRIEWRNEIRNLKKELGIK